MQYKSAFKATAKVECRFGVLEDPGSIPRKDFNFVLLIVPSRYFCGGSFCFMSWCLKYFCAVGALCVFAYF